MARIPRPGAGQTAYRRSNASNSFSWFWIPARDSKSCTPCRCPPIRCASAKRQTFERLRGDYRLLRDTQWAGDNRYDAWINAPMNNARLLPFGLYDQWVPAFAALFRQVGGDWVKFYAAVEKLGALPVEKRKAALEGLAGPRNLGD